MTKLRTAIIGAGKMGKIHAKVYSNLDNVQLVAVADSDIEHAKALAEKHDCIAVSDPAELVGKVDAVTISAPTIPTMAAIKVQAIIVPMAKPPRNRPDQM